MHWRLLYKIYGRVFANATRFNVVTMQTNTNSLALILFSNISLLVMNSFFFFFRFIFIHIIFCEEKKYMNAFTFHSWALFVQQTKKEMPSKYSAWIHSKLLFSCISTTILCVENGTQQCTQFKWLFFARCFFFHSPANTIFITHSTTITTAAAAFPFKL